MILPEYAMSSNGFIGMQKQEDAYNSFKSLRIDDRRFINIIAQTALIPHEYCRIGQNRRSNSCGYFLY